MPLFIVDNQIKTLKENPFLKEKDMQKLVEKNLEELFHLKFITSEYSPHGGFRIDTLAYNSETNSFVIIEYKKGDSWSVIDQGFSYLSLLLNNKADFVLKYQEATKKHCGINDIEWDASKVIFVAPSFNLYQTESLGFQDMPFELWEMRRYEKDIIALSKLQTTSKAKLSKMEVSRDMQKVQQELKTYTIDYHFNENWTVSREIFDELLPQLLKMHPSLEVKIVKKYIAIQMQNKNIFCLTTYKSGIEIAFTRSRPKDFIDPEKRVKEIKDSMKHFNQYISWYMIESTEDIPYALMLAKQALKKYL